MFRYISILIFVIILGSHISSIAQISSGGTPIFYNKLKGVGNELIKEHKFIPAQTAFSSTQEGYNKSDNITFAYAFNVNYTPDNSGEWTMTNEMRVWHLEIKSEGAYTINLIFDRFVLPEGAKLFLYNADGSDIKGAFTSRNNKETGVLATEPVIGDKVIVEYQEPYDVDFEGELLIGAVNHDYVGIYDHISKSVNLGFEKSCEENVDVSCSDLEGMDDLKRSVLRMIVNGSEYCTATLINNTSEDSKPYVITAAHCFRYTGLPVATTFLFNYETPYCSEGIEGSTDIFEDLQLKAVSVSGSNVMCMVPEADYMLLELSETPPDYYRPYYAGWSLSETPPKPFATIHHPSGDVKKVSTAVDDIIATTFNQGPITAPDYHWWVTEWATGLTEGGSSGAALFDANNLLVGTLSGGEANCNYGLHPKNDYYARLNKAWDTDSEAANQLKTYLDPLNTGAQSLNGFDPYGNDRAFRITNVEENEIPDIRSLPDNGGYISGHNSSKIINYAEKYNQTISADIKGLYLLPSRYTNNSQQNIKIGLWIGNSEPTLLITELTKNVGDFSNNKEHYIELDKTYTVEGNFFVTYELEYLEPTVDSFAVYHSGDEILKGKNSMMVKNGGIWKMASDFYNLGNTSLWIDVVASNVTWGDTSITIPEEHIVLKVASNPIKTKTITIINEGYSNIERAILFNLRGEKIQDVLVNQSSKKIDIPLVNTTTGVYLLKVIVDSKTEEIKILVE